LTDFLRDFLKFLLLYVARPVLLLVGALFSSFYNVLFAWWIGNRKRKPSADGFPPGFRVQRIGVTRAVAVSGLPGAEIAKYLRDHPETAKALLGVAPNLSVFHLLFAMRSTGVRILSRPPSFNRTQD